MKGDVSMSHYWQKGVVVMTKMTWPIVDLDGVSYEEDEFVQKFDSVVTRACWKYGGSKARNRSSFEDLSQHAWMTTLRNLSKYDRSLGYPLSAFVYAYARGGVFHFLRDLSDAVRLTRTVKETMIKLSKYTREHDRVFNYHDAKAIAEEFDLNEQNVRDAIYNLANMTLSLDTPVSNKEGKDNQTYMDLLVVEDTPEDDRIRLIEQAIEMLKPREKMLVQAKLDGVAQKELGERLQISQMHTSRLQRRAIDRVRHLVNVLQVES